MKRSCARLFCIIGLLAALVTTAHALTVAEVAVRSLRATPVPADLVRANIEITAGTEFDPQVLSGDVKRLYQTGFFSNVQTEVMRAGEDRVKVVFKVDARLQVQSIRFRGNRLMDTDRLRSLVTLQPGELLDEQTLAEDRNAIRELYEKSGYHGTDVQADSELVPGTRRANVTFVVRETQRAKVRGVEFLGNDAFDDKTLRKQMKTKHHWWYWLFSTGYFDEKILREDLDRVRSFYADSGYLDIRIENVERQRSENGKWITLVIHISEGQPYTVTSISVDGNRHFSDGELLERISLEAGMQYDDEQKSEDLRAIRSEYENLGYIDVRVYSTRDVNPDDLTLSLTYHVDEGGVYHVRDVYITGNRVTRDKVIRRELSLHPGDLAKGNRIDNSRRRLLNLNYFKSVEIDTLPTENEDLKDISVSVQEKRTGQLMVGAGFSSEEDVVGTIEVSQSNFDWKNWPTFRGGGQRMRLRVLVGSEKDEFVLSFTEPWWLDRPLRLDLDAYKSFRDEDDYTRERTGAGMTLTRRWRQFWRQSIGVRIQTIDLNEFDDGVSAELLAEEGSYEAHTLTLGLARDTRNRVRYPTQGSRMDLGLDLMSEAWGSYTNLYRLRLSGTKYFPMIAETVLKLRGEVGVVDRFSGDEIAIFDRFFAGGTYSMRGFERREVGPVDNQVDEAPLGGESMLIGSAEVIYPIFNRVRIRMFCDAGNVWADAYDFNVSQMNVSVGLGLQFDLPIGPVRFDYGIPVVTDQEHLSDNSGRLHFNISF